MSLVIRHQWQEVHTGVGLSSVFCVNCGLHFSAANDWGRQDSPRLEESELPACVDVLREKVITEARQSTSEGGV